MGKTATITAAIATICALSACGADDAGPTDVQTECDATHALVGTTAALSERFHDVSGTVRVVDDCTLEIENFTFDGGGLDVRITVAEGTDYANGTALTGDLLGDPIDGETMTLPLPTGLSLDDFDHISVWCVAAGEDFGSAEIK